MERIRTVSAVTDTQLQSTRYPDMPHPFRSPDREFAMLFTATPQGANLARRIAVKRLRWWGITPDTPALLIGELVANAVMHTRPRPHQDYFLRLAASGRSLRIEVADVTPDRRPELRKPADNAENGRGLVLVDAISSAWGVSRRPTGKTVWCELPAVARPDTPVTASRG